MILGIDLGGACGWAIVAAERVLASGALDLPRGERDHPGARYAALARWLETDAAALLAKAGGEPVVVVEDVVSHQRTDKVTGKTYNPTLAAHAYGGYRAIVAAWAAAHGLAFHPIGVGTWKNSIGLAGAHAGKPAVWSAVRLLGYRPNTQDEADAIGIALGGERVLRMAAIAHAAGVPTLQPRLNLGMGRRRRPLGAH